MEEFIRTAAPNLYTYRDKFWKSFGATFEMFWKAGGIVFLVGLFFGVLLVVTRKGGIRQNLVVYQLVNTVVNLFRSIPFIILLIFLIPLTRAVVGTAINVKGAILPLVFGAVPFYTRQVEVALSGGIGSFAINYGQNQNHPDIVNACVIVLLLLTFLLQGSGNLLARRTHNRKLFVRIHRKQEKST